MDKLGHKSEMPRFSWDRILGEPDSIGQQRFTTGIHNTVEGGVVGMGERVEAVLGCRLQGSLNADQGISQLGCFGRAVVLFGHDHSYLGREKDKKPAQAHKWL